MAASGIDKIGVDLGYGGFEASAEQHQSDSWSLGCDITIEDADATLHEVRVNDITISGVVSTEELSVDINSLESDSMNLDVNFVVDGISSSLVEAQIVPFDKIIDINDLSPEATAETRFASSARAAKIIYDLIATLKDRVDKIEVNGGGGSSEGTGKCWWDLDENTGEIFTTMPVRVENNIVAYGQVSSGGIGEEGEGGDTGGGTGGGGGTSDVLILDDWDNYDESLPQVLGAVLGMELYRRLLAVEGGTAVPPDLTEYATKKFVETQISNLINGAPEAYDTLKEIADILDGNVNNINDILVAVSKKASKDELSEVDTRLSGEIDEIRNLINSLVEMNSYWQLEDGHLKTDYNVYSTKQISSGGIGEEGESGGGISGFALLESWDKYDESVAQALGASLGVQLYNRIKSLEDNPAMPDLTPYATKTYVTERLNDLWSGVPSAYDSLLKIANVLQGNRKELDQIAQDILNLQTEDTHIKDRLERLEDLWREDEDGNLWTNRNVYSLGQISSGGVGSEGTGGGGGSNVDLTEVFSRLGIVEDEIADIKSVLEGIEGNIATQILNKADRSELANYLPLSGGTMTGPLTISTNEWTNQLILNGIDANAGIQFKYSGALMGTLFSAQNELYWMNESARKIIHEGNIGEYVLAKDGTAASAKELVSINAYAGDLITYNYHEGLQFENSVPNTHLPWATGYNNAIISLNRLMYTNGYYISQLGFSANGMYYRAFYNQAPTKEAEWKTLAFLDSNVASATKLATSRKIWGQSFDGSADISGAITGVSYIAMNGHIGGLSYINDNATNGFMFGSRSAVGSEGGALIYAYGNTPISMYAGGWERMHIASSGNVGIGTDVPDYKLDVRGNLATIGDIRVREGGFYLQNDKSLRFYLNGNATDMDVFRVSTSNEIEIGGDAPFYGVNTIIKGKKIMLRQNIWDTRLEIAENGDTYINKNLYLAEAAYINGEIYLGNNAEGIFYYKDTPRFCYHNQGTWVSNLMTFAHNRVTIHQHLSLANALYVDINGNGFMMAGTDYYSYIARTEDGQWKEDIFNFYPNGDNYAFGKFIFAQLIRAEQGIKIGDATITWDAENNALKIDNNVYSDGQVSSGGVAEAGGVSLKRVVFTIPSGATSFTCEHGLETKDISVSIYEEGNDHQQVLADVYLDTTNIARIVFGSATDMPHKVVIIG